MFARATVAAGLGPAEVLPPTLQPMAVFAAAPHAPRGASLLGALVIYALCAGALLVAPKALPVPSGFRPRGDEKVIDLRQPKTERPLMQTPPAPKPMVLRLKDAPERPAGWTPPVNSLEVPTETPATLPTENQAFSSVAKDDGRQPLAPAGSTDTHAFRGPYGEGGTQVLEMETTALRVLHRVDPVYPALARMVKRQGEVVLLLTIDGQGVPIAVRPLSSPDPSLEAEAVRVARLWRFEPARVSGEAVHAQFRLTIAFRLR